MKLYRSTPPRSLISLVSMVDVLMIMLVFFMVTSTYLNLDMVPMAERSDTPADETPAPEGGAGASPLLIRLGADGVAHVQGQPQTAESLTALIAARVAENPAAPVIVLPSGAATTQALVSLMELSTNAGGTRLRIVRLEARP